MKEEPEHINRSWFNLTNILIAVVLLFLLVFLIWNQTISEKIFLKQAEESLMTTTPLPTAFAETPIPSEFYSHPEDTLGIIIAGGVLMVIIFGSAFWKIRNIRK
ncbi:MAG: hypothetical protein ACYC59_04970 [Anaerolineaceae bacterium]